MLNLLRECKSVLLATTTKTENFGGFSKKKYFPEYQEKSLGCVY